MTRRAAEPSGVKPLYAADALADCFHCGRAFEPMELPHSGGPDALYDVCASCCEACALEESA